MSTWRTIESAPKDGTVILACGNCIAPMAFFWGQFHPNALGKPCWRDHRSRHRYDTLTHWMPLPKAPAGLEFPWDEVER